MATSAVNARIIFPVTAGVTNMYTPPTATGGVPTGQVIAIAGVIKRMTVTNHSAAPVTLNLYQGASGASAAGTEWEYGGQSIPANSSQEYVGPHFVPNGDYITAIAGTNGAITIVLDVENRIVG